jgi:hypothetical protein
MGGWVDSKDGLDAVVKREISALAGNRNPVIHPVTNYFTD